MPIDTVDPDSPGGWAQYLANKLLRDQPRLQRLDDYWAGRPPMPYASEGWNQAFRKIMRMTRTNFASLIVQGPRDRLSIRAFRTDDTEDGDEVARERWLENDLERYESDVYRYAFAMSRGYVAVGQEIDSADGSKKSFATVEDPRQFITEHDPVRPQRIIAAMKIFHDARQRKDFMFLWLRNDLEPGVTTPGAVLYVAQRARRARQTQRPVDGPANALPPIPVTFSSTGFSWIDKDGNELDPVAPEPYEMMTGDIPVVLFENRDGVGEFENHTDILDRINHGILQRVVIATMQAFRQRGIEVTDIDTLPAVDDAGQPVDYNQIFSADPGALWKLPPGAKIWESAQVDLTSILASSKDDVLTLASVTQTPLFMFTPDAAAQSAEGASVQREGQTFKVEDRQRIFGQPWARVMFLLFTLGNEAQRIDLSKLSVSWSPAERYSLAERASADSLAVSLPFEVKLAKIWQMTPEEIARAKTLRQSDLVFQQSLAAVQAAGQPKPPDQQAALGAAQQSQQQALPAGAKGVDNKVKGALPPSPGNGS